MDHKKVRLLEVTDTEFKRDIVVSLRRNQQGDSKTEAFYNYLTHYILRRKKKKRSVNP